MCVYWKTRSHKIKSVVFTGLNKATEMLYHCNIFLSSNLVTESRVLYRYSRKETFNQINLKVYFSRPFQILIFTSCDKLTFEFDKTDLRKWDWWSCCVFFLPVQVYLCIWMYLGVSPLRTSWLTSYKPHVSKWLDNKSATGKAANSAPMFQTQENLPRNRHKCI